MLQRFFFVVALIATAFWLKNSALCAVEALEGHAYTLPPPQLPLDHKIPTTISFSEKWQVLGPFRCGTREAVWGADPLESWGGFSNLPYDEGVRFNSALSPDGMVKWGVIRANTSGPSPEKTKAEIVVNFPQIDWGFLRSIYGWSALQYQTWARGHLQLNGSTNQTVAIFTGGVLEFSIDGKRHFGGDFYSYQRAPLILSLTPGEHIIDLRLIRDVRALGGLGEPTIQVALEVEIRRELLNIDERSLLVPETTNGRFGSIWASIDVQNNVDDWIEVLSLESHDVPLLMHQPLHLSPYQIRPLVFRFAARNSLNTDFLVNITYRFLQEESSRTQSFQIKLTERSLSQPQRLTYIHSGSVVSYAILRPPPLDSVCINRPKSSMPIILGLHGAGLEANSVQVREMLDAAYGVCAWMLFPSGVTSWSGDDWHTWGIADIKAAIQAVSQWMEAVDWTGPGISPDDWITIGHSNGGQGVWFLATHYPDNVIAAAPVSGYSSIENYVPYNMWQDSEPLLSSVLHRSRSSFKHELLLGNIAGIPILQQHGSDDTNVPAYHSRLMHELLDKAGWHSEYSELPGKGHWFDGVMTTPALLEFYKNSIESFSEEPLSTYTLSVPSSGDMESKGGIYVDQLQSPDTNGLVKVSRDVQSGVWSIYTQNIHRFHLSAKICRSEMPVTLVLDERGYRFDVDHRVCESTWYVKDAQGEWKSSNATGWQQVSQRYGRQVGALDAILRTWGTFTITMCSRGIDHIALQTSRNLLQYFAADSHLASRCDPVGATSLDDQTVSPGNVITLAIANDLPEASISFPIRVSEGQIILLQGCLQKDFERGIDLEMDGQCHKGTYQYEDGMGALFLRPLGNERLELVVWGADIQGLEQAARLVPTLTGVGQPEFLILRDSCRWKGHSGLYAAGHFDKYWQISAGSYVSAGI